MLLTPFLAVVGLEASEMWARIFLRPHSHPQMRGRPTETADPVTPALFSHKTRHKQINSTSFFDTLKKAKLNRGIIFPETISAGHEQGGHPVDILSPERDYLGKWVVGGDTPEMGKLRPEDSFQDLSPGDLAPSH